MNKETARRIVNARDSHYTMAHGISYERESLAFWYAACERPTFAETPNTYRRMRY